MVSFDFARPRVQGVFEEDRAHGEEPTHRPRNDKVRRDERGRFVTSNGEGDKGSTAGSIANVPMLVAVAAGLVAIIAGAVNTSAALRRNSQ